MSNAVLQRKWGLDWRAIGMLASSASLAQLLSLSVQPLLARLYTPHDFGVFTLYLTLLSLLAVLATARYEWAIVLPTDPQHAANLLGLSLLFASILALLVGFIHLLGSDIALLQWLHPSPNIAELSMWLALLPLALWLAGATQAWTQWNNRHQRYRLNAAGRLCHVASMSVTQLIAASSLPGPGGLIVGQCLGQLSALFLQAQRDIRQGFAWRRWINWRGLKMSAHRYRDFPKLNTPHALITALQDLMVLGLLASSFGAAAAGYYGMTIRLLKLPAALIGQSIAQVSYREFAASHQQQNPLRPWLKKMLLPLIALAMLPYLLIRLAGEELFTWLLGASWQTAGQCAEALALFICFHFIVTPLATIPMALKRQHSALFFSIVQTALFVIAILTGFTLWADLVQSLFLVSWIMVGYFMLYLFWLFHITK